MPFTQSQLDALETAISSGTLEVTVGDKRIRYHSLEEMLRLREIMKQQLTLTVQGAKSRASFASFYKD